MGRPAPRDVIRVFDTQISEPKWKRFICVSPERRLFLRINSNPYWPPHVKIREAENRGFLDHDSYVELTGLVRVPIFEFNRAIARSDNPMGRVTESVAREIAFAAQRAATLSDEHRQIIRDALVSTP